ncbi:serine/threonine protein kinase [Nannocystis pusilla]|uniref:non-specific serine/threonine protein kinase n=1 Tax=Nannocystis pusilla TaxID=889268 RepID=A0ABS7TPE2_9BACT|nr:serine/threonine-protein kinase [Nannocystis pusilla]MBZ5710012.1 serine/threonine protein kinase [Nannocystis pusilla]
MPEFTASERVVGRNSEYVVGERLGEGGFGLAFVATAADGRRVVLKQLRVARMGDWKAMELFEREARVLASLAHPNIPRCHEFFATDGARAVDPADIAQLGGDASLVLVQDHVDGASLAARIAAGERMTAAQAEALLRELLGVLDYLHGLHPPVVHRDIKPANIVVTPAGEPMLIDFGAIQERLRRDSEVGSTTVGTFGFFPMEQVLGKARPASDLYALAMTMVVALTHRQPDELPIDPETSKVVVRSACPGLPERLARALDGMLEPAVGRRLASARDVLVVLAGDALQRRENSLPVPAARSLPPAVYKAPLYTGGAAALLLYGFFFDAFSETDLVALSFVWLPLVLFGLGARLNDSIAGGLRWAVLGTLLLGVFILGVFPAL